MNNSFVEYKKLSKILNGIINDKTSNELIYAIDSLNIIKPHKDFLAKQSIFFQYNFFILFFFFIVEINKNFAKWLVKFLINFFTSFFYKENQTSKKDEIFVISHLVNKNFLNISNDFIYGNSLIFLKKNYKNIKYIYLNHTSVNSRVLSKNIKNKNIIILNNILSLKEELKIIYYQYLQVKKLFLDFYITKKINLFFFFKIFISIFSRQSKLNLRYYFQFLNLYKKNSQNIKFVISTFEGHSWEKLLFYATRTKMPFCKRIGYQHVGILKNEFLLKKIRLNNYNPDYIFTCGKTNKNFFLKYNNDYFNRVFVFGSNRNIKAKNFNKINKSKKTCLVLPEGTNDECSLLFEYTLNIAKRYSNTYFIWRTHPLIDIDIFLSQSNFIRSDIPNNIIISKKDFFYDIKRSTFVLYRGSSSVITALLNKLIPIYYEKKDNNFFDIDPLYLLDELRMKVTSQDDYLRVLKYNFIKNKSLLRKYISFAKKIYSPIKKGNIIKILDTI
jgi:hypothetical protein